MTIYMHVLPVTQILICIVKFNEWYNALHVAF
jgi:hypothetical protein